MSVLNTCGLIRTDSSVFKEQTNNSLLLLLLLPADS